MTLYLFRFHAPLRGYKAVNIRSQPNDTADRIAYRAIAAVVNLYGFGMAGVPGFDGLRCIGMTDGARTIGWGGLLKDGWKQRVSG